MVSHLRTQMGLELLPRPRTWPVTTGDCPRAVTACSVSILPGTLRLCPHPLLAGGCDDPGPPLSYDVLNSVAEEALGSPPDPPSPMLCPCTCTVLFDGQQTSGEPVSQAIRKAISQPGPGSQTSVLGRIAWRACNTQISMPGPGTLHSLGRRALREAAWHPATTPSAWPRSPSCLSGLGFPWRPRPAGPFGRGFIARGEGSPGCRGSSRRRGGCGSCTTAFRPRNRGPLSP